MTAAPIETTFAHAESSITFLAILAMTGNAISDAP